MPGAGALPGTNAPTCPWAIFSIFRTSWLTSLLDRCSTKGLAGGAALLQISTTARSSPSEPKWSRAISHSCPSCAIVRRALVGPDGREFYVEVIDTWREDDCSDFVKQIVLPQLWGSEYAMPLTEARSALLRFLAMCDEELEVVTDAPEYDWELFCELAYYDGKWPRNVRNFPTNSTTMSPTSEGKALPHHALLDPRIITSMFAPRFGGENGLAKPAAVFLHP